MPEDEKKLRRLCHACMVVVDPSRWEVVPPDRIDARECDACGKHRILVQECWLTDGEVAEILLA